MLCYVRLVSQHLSRITGTAEQAVAIEQHSSTGTWRSTGTSSRVGPKSDRSPGRHVGHWLFVLLLFTQVRIVESGAADARVDAGATTAPGITGLGEA